MTRSLAAVAGVALAAVVLAAPVPAAKKNQWLIASVGQIYLFTEGDKEPKKLTDSKAHAEHPAWSPDGKQIAFYSDRNGLFHIFTADADGKNVKQITTGKCECSSPTWSPDGRRIAFQRKRESGENEICTANAADGEDCQVLSSSEDFHPAFSPDGKSIAFVSTRYKGDFWLHMMGADGKNATRLVEYEFYNGCASPAWSPNGKQIAFIFGVETATEIHIVNADGTGLKALTKFGKRAVYPTWSPDGKQIAFFFDNEAEGKERRETALWVMDADGGNQKEVLKLAEIPIEAVAWRPK